MDDSDAEAAIISTLSGDTYHKLCSEPPLAQLRILPVSKQLPVRLGTIMIFSSNSQYGTLSRIIEPLPIRLGCESSIANMQYHCGRDYHGGDVLANSWIRYFGFDTDSVPSLISSLFFLSFGSPQVRTLNLSARVRRSDEACKPWLAQATGIFTQLQITSRLENYGASLTFGALIFRNVSTKQSLCAESNSPCGFYATHTILTNRTVTCSFVHRRIFAPDQMRFSGQVVPPIGPTIHQVPSASAPRRQQSSDFL